MMWNRFVACGEEDSAQMCRSESVKKRMLNCLNVLLSWSNLVTNFGIAEVTSRFAS